MSKALSVIAVVATAVIASYSHAAPQSKSGPKAKPGSASSAKFLKPGYSAEYIMNLSVRSIAEPQAFSGFLKVRILDQSQTTPAGVKTHVLNSKGEFLYSTMRGEMSAFLAVNPKSSALEIHGFRPLGARAIFGDPEQVRPGWVKVGSSFILPELMAVPGTAAIPVTAIEREVVSTTAGDFQSFRCEGVASQPVVVHRTAFDEVRAVFRVVAWYSNELGLLKAEIVAENYMYFPQNEDSRGILLGVNTTSVDAQMITLPDGRVFGGK